MLHDPTDPATYAPETSMFEDVCTMNDAFGNPKGNPHQFSIQRIEKQCKNIGHEHTELMDAIKEDNLLKIRDALCDIMVFTLGAYHLMGIDAEADMRAVFDSNMSKFCRDETELEATREKYRCLGVPFYVEGEFPRKYLKASEDCTDGGGNEYAKGKFLKGVNYREPVLAEIAD